MSLHNIIGLCMYCVYTVIFLKLVIFKRTGEKFWVYQYFFGKGETLTLYIWIKMIIKHKNQIISL